MTKLNECARELKWGGGKHVFCLNRPDVIAVLSGDPRTAKLARSKAGTVIRLEKLTGANGDTPAACLQRFDGGTYSIPDIERVMLYGLWGGGKSLQEAQELVATHVRGKPLADNAKIAFEVLAALFLGAVNA
jgi:hypothetical protein